MAAFSSRGPLGDFIKPDITAPGIQILAGMTPQPTGTVNGPPGQALPGDRRHVDVEPARGRRLGARQGGASGLDAGDDQVGAHDLGRAGRRQGGRRRPPATPFDDGAGSIRADRAVNPTLVFDETYADFVASATDPLHRIDLNLASIDATTMTGEITTKRTAHQRLGQGPGARRQDRRTGRRHVSITGRATTAQQGDINDRTKKTAADVLDHDQRPEQSPTGSTSARITLDPEEAAATNSVTIPVAFVKKQGAVTLTHTCAPTTFPAKTGVSALHGDASPTSAARRPTST